MPRDAFANDSDMEEDEEPATKPVTKTHPTPAPKPQPTQPAQPAQPAAPKEKKKRSLHRPASRRDDSDQEDDEDDSQQQQQKGKKPKADASPAVVAPTQTSSKKREVVAGTSNTDAQKKQRQQEQPAAANESDDDDGTNDKNDTPDEKDDATSATTADATSVDSNKENRGDRAEKQQKDQEESNGVPGGGVVSPDAASEDGDDDEREFGQSITEIPPARAANAVPHPKPACQPSQQQNKPETSGVESSSALPSMLSGQKDVFKTQLPEEVEFFIRGSKKNKRTQRSQLFSLCDHLAEEGFTIVKAEFVPDKGVPPELKHALTTVTGEAATVDGASENPPDSKRMTIPAIDMPFDTFLSGNEDKFLTTFFDTDPHGRQKLLAASIIAVDSRTDDIPKAFCFFLRLNIVPPQSTCASDADAAALASHTEATSSWPSFETFMAASKREVVVSIEKKVVENAIGKAFQDSVFFVPGYILTLFAPTPKSRGGRGSKAAPVEAPTKNYVYKQLEVVKEKDTVALCHNITGPVKKRAASGSAGGAKHARTQNATSKGPGRQKSSSSQSAPSSSQSTQGTTQVTSVRRPVEEDGDDDDDDDENEEGDKDEEEDHINNMNESTSDTVVSTAAPPPEVPPGASQQQQDQQPVQQQQEQQQQPTRALKLLDDCIERFRKEIEESTKYYNELLAIRNQQICK